MKKSTGLFGPLSALIVATLLSSLSLHAESKPVFHRHYDKNSIPSYRAGHLLVKRKEGIQGRVMARVHQRLGAKVEARYTALGALELVRFSGQRDMKAMLNAYRSDPNVEYAEPDYIVYADDVPNDPDFSKQWFLQNDGSSGGITGVDINADALWNISKGSEDVVIVVIDTGIDYKHPDLEPNIWTNPNPSPELNDLHGYNAILNNGDPMDDNKHGTHVAGIIGAAGNNGVGISGVMQNVRLAACKFLSESGSGSTADAIKCINYVAELKKKGVNVIATNNSWSGGAFQQAMFDAVEQLHQLGVLFVAAASNSAQNNDVVGTYPANYDCANVISVAASDNKDELASFSNYGRYSVHVAAPGVNIYSTLPNNHYGSLSGTSMATPVVAGIVGMIASVNPQLTMAQVRNLILSSGQDVKAAEGKTISGRRVRAADVNGVGALTCKDRVLQTRLSPRSRTLSVKTGVSVPLSFLSINCSETFGPVNVNVSSSHGSQDVLELKSSADGIFKGEFVPHDTGTYNLNLVNGETVQVVAYDSSKWQKYKAVTNDYEYVEFEGTPLRVGDDTVHAVSVPFPLRFGVNEPGLSSLYVQSNGAVSLTDNKVLSWQNKPLPLAGYEAVIAPYWDDLVPGGAMAGDVFVGTLGEAPNRKFVIEWRNMIEYDSYAPVTFEAVFFENSSDIVFNYKTVMVKNEHCDNGASATVGVQVRDSLATLYSYNQPKLADHMSLKFRLSASNDEDMEEPAPVTSAPEEPVLPTHDVINMSGVSSEVEEVAQSSQQDSKTSVSHQDGVTHIHQESTSSSSKLRVTNTTFGCSSLRGNGNLEFQDLPASFLMLAVFLLMRRRLVK